MSAAISALNTVTIMGYELEIPHWVFACILTAVGLFFFSFAGRLFETFCFLKVLKDKKVD